MTDVYQTPEKVARRDRLFEIAEETLRSNGWKVERVPGLGKASVRRISKGSESLLVSIRTTQDQWIAFPRDKKDKTWITLPDVDVVVAVSVDEVKRPKFALVHWFEAHELRDRFDRTYKARMEAKHRIPLGRGVWLALYIVDDGSSPRYVGGGVGLDHPEIARVPLAGGKPRLEGNENQPKTAGASAADAGAADDDKPLTIAAAKRRLARSLGVSEASIKISVEA